MITKKWYCKNCQKNVNPTIEGELNQSCGICNAALSLVHEGEFSWSEVNKNEEGVLRYSSLIPVTREALERVCDVKYPEFVKPVESKRLAEKLGVKSVHLLSALSGPSGTFKDSEAAVVIAKCLDWKIDKKLSWHSTGNTARAYREYAIKAGFESDSYFPLSCINKFKGIEKNSKNKLIGYDGPFQNISAIAKVRAKENNTLHLAPLPWKIEGKALLSYCILENLPDTNVIVQTIAGGYGVLGLQLGIERLKLLKIMNETLIPRYELFQIEEADAISRLMLLNRNIEETDLRLPVNPFEPTLQSTNPLSTFNNVRNIVVNTESRVSSVSVEEITNTYKMFEDECHALNIPVSYEDEKSPFITWAGLVKLKSENKLKPEDRMVIIVTGSKIRKGDVPQPDLIINN
jgi:threonine synthase